MIDKLELRHGWVAGKVLRCYILSGRVYYCLLDADWCWGRRLVYILRSSGRVQDAPNPEKKKVLDVRHGVLSL